ncbi:unnamed protein product [Protopolystoma xenopodis]|uniref:Uncharacterized protein n=1 Tax=Protopolystoma xenopodis TaxID=117903 RepID=A0A3S5BF09_9PLAT|nr:unnamed protein product [Protopolystoma xenopodis]
MLPERSGVKRVVVLSGRVRRHAFSAPARNLVLHCFAMKCCSALSTSILVEGM